MPWGLQRAWAFPLRAGRMRRGPLCSRADLAKCVSKRPIWGRERTGRFWMSLCGQPPFCNRPHRSRSACLPTAPKPAIRELFKVLLELDRRQTVRFYEGLGVSRLRAAGGTRRELVRHGADRLSFEQSHYRTRLHAHCCTLCIRWVEILR